MFGRPSPYSMPASELSFLTNVKTTLWVMGRDLTALGPFAGVIVNKYILGIICLAMVLLVLKTTKPPLQKLVVFLQDHRDRLLLALFLFFYMLTIIVARSVYRWGEIINSRHFSGIYWIVLFLSAVVGEWVMVQFVGKRTARYVLFSALCLLVASQLCLSVKYLVGYDNESADQIRSAAVTLGRIIPEDKLVLTDAYGPLRFFGHFSARCPRRSDRKTPLTWNEIKQAGDDGRLWGIVIVDRDKYAQGKYGSALKQIASNPDDFPQLQQRELVTGLMVLEFRQEGTPTLGTSSISEK